LDCTFFPCLTKYKRYWFRIASPVVVCAHNTYFSVRKNEAPSYQLFNLCTYLASHLQMPFTVLPRSELICKSYFIVEMMWHLLKCIMTWPIAGPSTTSLENLKHTTTHLSISINSESFQFYRTTSNTPQLSQEWTPLARSSFHGFRSFWQDRRHLLRHADPDHGAADGCCCIATQRQPSSAAIRRSGSKQPGYKNYTNSTRQPGPEEWAIQARLLPNPQHAATHQNPAAAPARHPPCKDQRPP